MAIEFDIQESKILKGVYIVTPNKFCRRKNKMSQKKNKMSYFCDKLSFFQP